MFNFEYFHLLFPPKRKVEVQIEEEKEIIELKNLSFIDELELLYLYSLIEKDNEGAFIKKDETGFYISEPNQEIILQMIKIFSYIENPTLKYILIFEEIEKYMVELYKFFEDKKIGKYLLFKQETEEEKSLKRKPKTDLSCFNIFELLNYYYTLNGSEHNKKCLNIRSLYLIKHNEDKKEANLDLRIINMASSFLSDMYDKRSKGNIQKIVKSLRKTLNLGKTRTLSFKEAIREGLKKELLARKEERELTDKEKAQFKSITGESL